MTLPSETVRIQANGTGSQTVFPVTFIFYDLDDPKVTHTDSSGTPTTWVRGTEYSMTGGDGNTGTLTVITSPTDNTPASGETLTIVSNLAYTQLTDLPEGGAFSSDSVEQQLDKIVRMVQQKGLEIDRSLSFPVSDSTSLTTELAVASTRADKVVAFDSSGNVTVSTQTISTIEAGSTSAAASATAAATSEANAATSATNAATSETNAATSATTAASFVTPSTENFADGAGFTAGTTTFLTLAASLSSEDFIDVTFDGVTQHHDTYSLSGATLTFSSAIPTGTSNVEVRYGIRAGTVPFSSVSNTPTTLAGYGITDSISSSELTSHEADTSTHGVSVAIVGTTDTQTLTNKTLTAPTINGVIGGTQTSATITALTSTTINGVTAPTAQYTTAEETKLSGIETLADVTDSTNVLAALTGQEVVATGFTGTLDGILGGGTPAAASVTTLSATNDVAIGGSATAHRLGVKQDANNRAGGIGIEESASTAGWALTAFDSGVFDITFQPDLGSLTSNVIAISFTSAGEASFLNGVDIDSGAIDGTTIGATTVSSGAFTSVSADNRLRNTQTGTTYTLVLTDASKVISMNNAAANTLTIPLNSSVAFNINAQIDILMLGAGITTVDGSTGVTVNGVSGGGATIDAQYKAVTIIKLATDSWVIFGAHGTVA